MMARMSVVTTISLTLEELRALDEITKIEAQHIPRASRSGTMGFLIRFYSAHKTGEFKPLPPQEALKEAERLEKAALWYKLQAEADLTEAKTKLSVLQSAKSNLDYGQWWNNLAVERREQLLQEREAALAKVPESEQASLRDHFKRKWEELWRKETQ